MNKFLALLILFTFNNSFGQELSKEEKKRLKEEVKAYLNDLGGYKAKMEDIRITLDSNSAEIKRQKDDLAFAATMQAELENKLADFAKELERCHAEKNILRGGSGIAGDTTTYPEGATSSDGGYVTIAESTSPGRADLGGTGAGRSGSGATGGSGGAMNNTGKTGTVYKVQIGLYKKYNINKYFEEPRFIGYELEGGLNRYVISDFTDEGTAMNFVDDVRRMGIKDAFVAKYIDGQRVYEWNKNPKYKGKPVPTSLEEALELEKASKKGKKNE